MLVYLYLFYTRNELIQVHKNLKSVQTVVLPRHQNGEEDPMAPRRKLIKK